MSTGAVVLMIVSMVILWGGLGFSVMHYIKTNK